MRRSLPGATELGIASAVVYRGVEGYGSSTRIHRASPWKFSRDAPIMVSILDTEAQIARLIPHLEAMVGEGLIASSTVEAIRLTRVRPATRERIDKRKAQPASGPAALRKGADRSALTRVHDPEGAACRPTTPAPARPVPGECWRAAARHRPHSASACDRPRRSRRRAECPHRRPGCRGERAPPPRHARRQAPESAGARPASDRPDPCPSVPCHCRSAQSPGSCRWASTSRVTGRFCVLPSRITVRWIVVPGCVSLVFICSSPASFTGLPLSSVMTSPVFRPALLPGASGCDIGDHRARRFLYAEELRIARASRFRWRCRCSRDSHARF